MNTATDYTHLMMSLRGLATVTGLHRQTINNCIQKNNIQPKGQNKGHPVYALVDVLPHFCQAGPSTPQGGGKKTYTPLEQNQMAGAKLKTLKVQEVMGQLLRADQVRLAWADVIKQVMAGLETLPDVIEREVKLTPEQIVAMVATIDRMREDMAKSITDTMRQNETTQQHQGMQLVQ